MQMEQLDLEIRSKIYNYTKKILRKYQKGITTGKLTADKFVENIISSGDINDILDEKFLLENCVDGDLLITMGAGDVVKIGENLLGI